jgi:hypothetical protein
MEYDIMVGLLNLIKDVHDLSAKITEGKTRFYCMALSGYDDSLVINIMKGLAESWDKRYMPQPVVIQRLCHELRQEEQLDFRKEQERDGRSFKLSISKHQREVDDLVKRISGGQPLTEKQTKLRSHIEPYMKTWGDEWYQDLKNIDLNDEKNYRVPLVASFLGLYMNALENRLKPLTGVPKGNLVADPGQMKLPQERR